MTAPPIRALTVRQPWASAIASGAKTVENRTWGTSYRGLIAIHAGKGIDWEAPDRAWIAAGQRPYRDGLARKMWRTAMPLGAVVATGWLRHCHAMPGVCRSCDSPWAEPGQFHWVLQNVKPTAPIPCRGALSLWRLPGDVEDAVLGRIPIDTATGVPIPRRSTDG